MKNVILICSCVVFLFGCNEEEKALLASPQVVDVGVFDDCQVKYVNRGFEIKSFYIAKCEVPATTVSNVYEYRQGKTTRQGVKLSTINKVVECDEECIKEKELNKALSKLTEKEKEILGLK